MVSGPSFATLEYPRGTHYAALFQRGVVTYV